MAEKFGQETPEIKPSAFAEASADKEEKIRTPFETKEGEKFFAERLTSPEDPRIEKVQEILAGHFGKEEVDPVEVMKQAMTGKMETGEEVPPYLIHVAENAKGEIKGIHTSAVVEMVNSKGEISEKSGLSLGRYTLVSPEKQNQGIWEKLFQSHEEAAKKDAEARGLEIKGFMAEAHDEIEPIFNRQGIKRAYIKTKEGFQELPYEQPPLDWNPKTGKPAKDAGVVPEHLMLKLASGENKLPAKSLMEMVRGMYYYNNYREEEYFKNEKAYEAHTEFVEGIEGKLADFIGRKAVHLLSREERETVTGKGVNFIEHKTEEIKPEVKSKAEMKKEWREHFGGLAEVQEEKEKMERAAKRAERKEKIEGWEEHFGALAEAQKAKEKAARELKEELRAVETAKIPEKGVKAEEVLKEVGIEKPAESFKDVQNRLLDKLEKIRARGGEKLSWGERNEIARDFYLGELGYSVKHKGLLHGKAELLDEAGKVVTDEKGKPMEFKTFFKLDRQETPLTDFLKEKLKNKLEGKPEKELTEEEKLELGFQKAVKTTENEQEIRAGKISALQEAKEVGMKRLSKLVEGLAYVAGFDKLAAPVIREGKQMAFECGKDLAAIGLSPAVAIEGAGREIAGRIQAGEALRKRFMAERKIEALEEIPADRRPEYYTQLLEVLGETSHGASEEMIRGYDKMFKKGKILRMLESWGGFGRLMGERLTPHIR